MNIGGLSRATNETWRGCQSILFPFRSLDVTQVSGRSLTITCVRARTDTQHTKRQERNTLKTTLLETVVVIRSACLTFCRHK